jgi:hypothetical protein
MNETSEPEEIEIRDLFPALSEEQLKAKRAFLCGYFEIALQIFQRLEKQRSQAIDENDWSL